MRIDRRAPRLLIASSTEGLEHAGALKRLLEPKLDTKIWDEGFFNAGEFALESLEEHSRDYDGALVIATADDRVASRSSESAAPRDNLIFEFGLFVAVFGRRRALLLVEEREMGVTIPSDINGLTYLPFTRTDPVEDGLKVAADALRRRAAQWQEGPLDQEQQHLVESLLGLSIPELQDRGEITSDLGLHVYLADKRADPEQLIRVARARLRPKSSKARPFLYGEGVVGTCWSRQEVVFADFSQGPLHDADRKIWDALPADEKLGMDWELLEASRKRYSGIAAVPVTSFRDETGFVGCVACNVGKSSPSGVLEEEAVERVLYFVAETMRVVLGH